MTTLERIINEGTTATDSTKKLLVISLKNLKRRERRFKKTPTNLLDIIASTRSEAETRTLLETLYLERKIELDTYGFIIKLKEQIIHGRKYRKA